MAGQSLHLPRAVPHVQSFARVLGYLWKIEGDLIAIVLQVRLSRLFRLKEYSALKTAFCLDSFWELQNSNAGSGKCLAAYSANLPLRTLLLRFRRDACA